MPIKPVREDFSSYGHYRKAMNQYHREVRDIKMARDKAIQAPLLKAFRQEFKALCNKYGVYIDSTSDESSDWHGVTGFGLTICFQDSEVEYPLYKE